MWPKLVRIAAAGFALLLLLEATRETAGDDDPPPRSVLLFYSGDTRGVLEPCGCTSGQLGGVVHRDSFLARARAARPDALVLDHGGLVDEPGRQPSMKFGVSLDAMRTMDYAVVNVGKGDLLQGVDSLVETAGASGLVFVSANVRIAGREPPFRAYRVVRAGDVSVAILGVLSPESGRGLGAGGYLVLEDPATALAPAIRQAREEAAVLVLLAHAGAEEAAAIAEACPDLAVVIHGGEEDEPSEPVRVGRTLVVSAGSKGRHLGRIEIPLDEAGQPGEAAHEAIPMDEGTGESARMKDLLAAYQVRLREERILETRPRGEHPRGKYAGSAACQDCHEREYGIWRGTAHSHAYETLEREKHDWDPECAVCHSTGFAWESGFLSPSATPALGGVGCESCHGPGEEHAARGGEVPTEPVAATTCRTCHTATQTPHFDYRTFFEKIAH